jgi:MFS family permease
MLDGLRYVRHSSLLTALTGVGFIAFLGIGALTVLDVLFVSRALRLPSADVGVLYSASGAGELLGGVLIAVIGARFAGRYHQLLAWSIVVNALAFVGYALSPTLWLAAGILFFVGLTFPPVIVSYMTMTQYVTEDAYMGRVNSVISSATGVAQILSVVSGGALADLFGVRQIIGAAAALWGLSGILTFLTIRATPEPRSKDQADTHPAAGEETISTVS